MGRGTRLWIATQWFSVLDVADGRAIQPRVAPMSYEPRGGRNAWNRFLYVASIMERTFGKPGSMTDEISASTATEDAVVRTFLIADVRGYTRYTQEQGDEAAARLTATFASLSRRDVDAYGGRVVEMRGDEVLAVFASARQALRAAVALQASVSTDSGAGFPLSIGIGLDAGEAVPVDGGYRGGALNLASRLAALAGPGQVLASDAVIHLGRAIPGIRYVEMAPQHVKGLDEPIRVLQVESDQESARAPGQDGRAESKRASLPDGGFLGARPSNRLVGRQQELQVCLRVVEDVGRGAGRMLLLSGEPGIGKTRLAQEIAVAAHGLGFLLGAGTCSQQRQMTPFFPFLDALTSLYRASPEAIQADLRTRCSILGRLLPDLGITVPPPSAQGQEEHVRLLRAIAEFLRSVSTASPVALMIDDLHWADSASVDLLDYLARSTRSHAVLMLGTYRSDEVDHDHPLYRTLLDLDRQRLAEVIPLSRFKQKDTGDLIASTIGEVRNREALVDLVQKRTDGNPFFVREVARSLVERGDLARQGDHWEARQDIEIEVPERVRAVIEQRLDGLPESARTILREASVLGQRFSFTQVQSLTQRQEEEIESALDQAAAIGLLGAGGGDWFEFPHALTQAALYAGLSTRRRRRLHLRVAEALERTPGAEGRAAELAWHFLQGDDSDRGIHYSIRAADQAQQVFAYGEAERLYRAALDVLWERETSGPDDNFGRAVVAAVLEKLGGVLRTVGRYEEALETLERAAQEYIARGDSDGEGRTIALVGQIYTVQGHPQEAITRLQSVLDAHPEAAGTGQVLLHGEMAHALNETGAFRSALHSAERAGQMARRLPNDRLHAAIDIPRAIALGMLGRYEEARSVFESTIPVIGNSSALVDALNGLGAYSFHAGAFEESRAYHEQALRVAQTVGDPGAEGMARLVLGSSLFALGRWPESTEQFDEAARVAVALDLAWLSDYVDIARARQSLFRGDREGARRLLWEAIEAAERDRDVHRAELAHSVLGESDMLAGDYRAARSHVEPFLNREEIGPHRMTVAALLLGRSLVLEGETERADDVLEGALAQATTLHNRPAFMEGLWVRGLLRARQEQVEEAGRLFAAAYSLAHGMPYPLLEARILQSWGELDQRRGLQESGDQRLQSALSTYERLGARHFLAHVRSLEMPEGPHR